LQTWEPRRRFSSLRARMWFNYRLDIWFLISLIIALLTVTFQTKALADPMAPNFCLRDLAGQDVCLEDFRGKLVLLDFWATWCLPCRASIPELNRLQDRYRNQGLVVLGIAVEDPHMLPDDDLRLYKQTTQMNYTVLRSDQKMISAYFPNQRPTIPTIFLIRPNGRIAKKIVGFLPNTFVTSLAELLK